MIVYDVVIIGAGAAGLMCAAEAGKRGRSVVVIEHAEKIGKKILISGGGRCNFTNKYTTHENFISQNPHFCKSALSEFSADDFISIVEQHKISYHEKKLGQLFCDGSSKQIVELLQDECSKANVKIITDRIVNEIKNSDRFEIETTREKYISGSVVIASGGISIPKMGATDFGYKIAEQFKHRIMELRPGLVPITLNETGRKVFSRLSGISVDSIVTCNKKSFRENILFTHRGISGPAVLQTSSYWKEGDELIINLLPEKNLNEIFLRNNSSRTELINFISNYFPKRFAEVFCIIHFKCKPLNQYSQKEFRMISEKFHNWTITPSGTEGFTKAEVTLGGIDTNELSSKTMESKKVKGLYFIGEVVDVTGWLGGYNFQWAWSSGFAAGKAV